MLPTLLFSALLLTSFAQAKGADLPGTYYRRRSSHALTVLGKRLYVDGGEISAYVDSQLPKGENDSSIAITNTTVIPLDKSWDNSNVHELFEYIDYPDEIQPRTFSAVWTDEAKKLFYRWGGEPAAGYSLESGSPKLGVFKQNDQGGGEWSTIKPYGSDPPAMRTTMVTCGGLGLSFGGSINGRTVANSPDTPLQGVLAHNLTDNSWTRYGDQSPPSRTLEQGQAICVEDFVEHPLVLLIGGKTWNPVKANNMSEIQIFDTVTKDWYKQDTIGAVPDDRFGFCAVGAKGKDGSSFEIFVYGGQSDKSTLGNICILTLPGFQWFCPDGAEMNDDNRTLFRCARAGNRQMIAVGGFNKFPESWKAPDEWPNGIGVFDLTKLKWSASFNADADPYLSPDLVNNWYSSSDREKLIWGDGVETLFSKALVNNSTTKGNSGNDTEDRPKKDPEAPQQANTGAIAGGVVAGVAVLSLAVAALWFIRRRRAHQGNEEETELDSKSLPAEVPAGLYGEAGSELDGATRHELAAPAFELEGSGTPLGGEDGLHSPSRPAGT